MHDIRCTRCQAGNEKPIQDSLLDEQQESYYICEDCLIQLLPESLAENDGDQADPLDETERRKSARFPVFSTVYLMEDHYYQPREMKSIILDVSSAGMKIVIPKQVDVGKIIQLRFYASLIIYKASGKVIRVQPFDTSDYSWFETGLQLVAIQLENR